MISGKFSSKIFSGISGLQLPVPKYLFPQAYQKATRLTYYATFFNSIEINSTFYKLPMPTTISKWATEVPEGFKFTFKVWKEITHIKHLQFKEQDVAKFFETIAGAAHKKGCVLIQLPPSAEVTHILQLEKLLSCIKQYNQHQGWTIAVEFRNKSWYQNNVYQLINSYKAIIVVHDMPKSATPLISHTLNTVYIRFHGPLGDYKGGYAEHFLADYAAYIKELLNERKTIFVYFNNTIGDAFKNLQTLNRLIIGI